MGVCVFDMVCLCGVWVWGVGGCGVVCLVCVFLVWCVCVVGCVWYVGVCACVLLSALSVLLCECSDSQGDCSSLISYAGGDFFVAPNTDSPYFFFKEQENDKKLV